MSKHTPGPWTFRAYEPDGPLDDAVHSLSPKAGDGDIVCMSPEHGGYEKSAEQWEANARLIAAAPSLLFALRALLRRANDELADPQDVHEIAVAEAAIAEATGAQP